MNSVRSKDSTRIAYDRIGQGPALILVTGAIARRTSAAPLEGKLAPHFTVYTYDRRGRGDNGNTPSYAVTHEIEDIGALINEAGGSAFVFGHSSGAVLGLEAASCLHGIRKVVGYEPPMVIAGGGSLQWMRDSAKVVARAIPGAVYRVLEGQTHGVADEVLVPVLVDFFA